MADLKKNKIFRRDLLRRTSETFSIEAMDGSCPIRSGGIFTSFIDQDTFNWGKKGIPTPKTKVKAYDVLIDVPLMDVFCAVPGGWNQKWLSQNQISNFCKVFRGWVSNHPIATIFLAKKNERKPIDESKPEKNVFVVVVYVISGSMYFYGYSLEKTVKSQGVHLLHVISPKLAPLVK